LDSILTIIYLGVQFFISYVIDFIDLMVLKIDLEVKDIIGYSCIFVF